MTADHPVADGLEVLEVAEASGVMACSLNDAVDGLDGREAHLGRFGLMRGHRRRELADTGGRALTQDSEDSKILQWKLF